MHFHVTSKGISLALVGNGGLEAGGGLLPVDDGPDSLEIVGLDVLFSPRFRQYCSGDEQRKNKKTYLVLQVKRVLPDVNAQNWNVGKERVLVGGGGDLEGA